MDLAVGFPRFAILYLGALKKDPHGEEARCAVSNHEARGHPSKHPQERAPQGEGENLPVTFDDVRTIALTWPEVEDGSSYGTPALKVRRKLLVRLREDGDSLVMLGVPIDERDMLVESQPKVFYFTDHYKDYPTVLIRLSKTRRATVEPLLRRQWRALASKKAVGDFDTSQRP
jgi:hypothetical protein